MVRARRWAPSSQVIIGICVELIMIGLILHWWYYSPSGRMQIHGLDQKITQEHTAVAQAEQTRARLEKQIQDFKLDDELLLLHARQLTLVRPDEKLYVPRNRPHK